MKKKVIITGAGRGIGLETAKIFDDQNWKVISIDKFFKKTFYGEKIIFNLNNLNKIHKLIESIGPVQTIVNNAATLFCDPINKVPEENSTDEFMREEVLSPSRVWHKVYDNNSGHYYYFNEKTKATQWHEPNSPSIEIRSMSPYED